MMDFQVIAHVRQHFGNDDGYLPGAFAGNDRSFPFPCPDIDTSERAVLLFQTRDVDHEKNVFEVNGNTIWGGIPMSPQKDEWNANVALVDAGWLSATDNELHIQSRTGSGALSGNIDDFLIDNIVVLYKTTRSATEPRLQKQQ